jgi:hypothetical protein
MSERSFLITIRYDLHDLLGNVDRTKFSMMINMNETLKDVKERFKQDWDLYGTEFHLIGYEETDNIDVPLYDEDVQVSSVYKPGFNLIFADIALTDDLK